MEPRVPEEKELPQIIDFLNSNKIIDIKKEYPKKASEMDSLLNAYYHATKYLYFNNKKLSK